MPLYIGGELVGIAWECVVLIQYVSLTAKATYALQSRDILKLPFGLASI